jgi:hypothetical protein
MVVIGDGAVTVAIGDGAAADGGGGKLPNLRLADGRPVQFAGRGRGAQHTRPRGAVGSFDSSDLADPISCAARVRFIFHTVIRAVSA